MALDVAWVAGIDAKRLAAGVQEDEIKNALRVEVEQAIARGVFGAPTIFVDGEMFWARDRLEQVERWITASLFKPEFNVATVVYGTSEVWGNLRPQAVNGARHHRATVRMARD